MKGGPLGFFNIQFVAKYQKFNEGPLETLKKFPKMFHSVTKSKEGYLASIFFNNCAKDMAFFGTVRLFSKQISLGKIVPLHFLQTFWLVKNVLPS